MKPRYYQTEAVQAVFDYFVNGNKGNPLIAMPTGTGKSVVFASLVKTILETWPNQRLMMLTHVKELVEQNTNKLVQMWPLAPVGIYSAGLKSKEFSQPIICGGIGSTVNNIEAFGHRDLLIVDEAHLISPKADTNYGKMIEGLQRINPHLKVIGLTATPYRMGLGLITEGNIFTDICYDITNFSAFNKLVSEGFLAPLISKKTATQLDVSNVSIRGGEYSQKQLDEAVNVETVTVNALKELCEYGQNRRSWLIFASSISHAESIAEVLQSFGIAAAAVHSKMTTAERDQTIASFKSGELQCIVNKDVLTTGFDHPPIDLIGVLRPTTSTGLWVQMLGRGTRPSADTEKENCLVLDFAGNTARLGPINDPVIPSKKGNKGEAPVKICNECGTYNHISNTVCGLCGHAFDVAESGPKIKAFASNAEVMKTVESDLPIIQSFEVKKVIFSLHEKQGAKPMIKATYYCGLKMFTDYLCFEHNGYASKKAREWWRENISAQGAIDTTEEGWQQKNAAPLTTSEALSRISELATPVSIQVHVNKKYPEIKEYIYKYSS